MDAALPAASSTARYARHSTLGMFFTARQLGIALSSGLTPDERPWQELNRQRALVPGADAAWWREVVDTMCEVLTRPARGLEWLDLKEWMEDHPAPRTPPRPPRRRSRLPRGRDIFLPEECYGVEGGMPRSPFRVSGFSG